jgi:7,8-dihydroneopterin aldolase/epimerase/oxygenase
MNDALRGLEPLGIDVLAVRKIFLRNLRVQASIGIHLKEMLSKQLVLLNIDLYVDARTTPLRDDIETVLDYDFLRQEIHCIAAARHFHLQETLCEEIMAICLSRPEVLAARVASAKPEAYADCESVGCEILRRRVS